MSEPLLEASGIVKSFAGVRALQGVDFAAHPGEVAALVGDNGAGKSTLVKILSGTLAPDGEIRFEGRRVAIPNPVAARELGIETVYQDLALAPELPAANLFLGRELVRPARSASSGSWTRRPCAAGPTRPSPTSGSGCRTPGPWWPTCRAASARASRSAGPPPGSARSCSWTSPPRPSAWSSPRTCAT